MSDARAPSPADPPTETQPDGPQPWPRHVRPPLLQLDSRFGPYRVIRLLGRGGMGEVYEAEHVESGRLLALKLLSDRDPSARAQERFLREGRLAASFSHANSVYVFGTEEIEGHWVIAMELVPGGTLRQRVTAQGSLAPADAVDAILDVIQGLEAAHRAGVLHRDVKPANCFVEPGGAVKVGDFGLSLSQLPWDSAHFTTTSSQGEGVMGTPAFAAPEQLAGEAVDHRADIYSVGATLYCLLTGSPPFPQRNAMRLLAAIASERPVPPHRAIGGVPAGLSAVVMKCLAKSPAARYQGYAALRGALLPFGTAGVTAPPVLTRFMALGIDAVLALAAVLALGLEVGGWPPNTLHLKLLAAGAMVVTTLSTLWKGGSPGEAICGLRVVTPAFGRPDLLRVIARGGAWAAVVAAIAVAGPWLARMGGLGPLALSLLFLTSRSRGSWRGVTELLSNTALVTAPRPADAAHLERPAAPPDTGGARRIGPYEAAAPEPRERPAVEVGFDPVLRRQVWIRHVPAGTPAIAAARRDASRATQVRWLNGARADDGGWDAYERPAGQPLRARCAERQAWPDVLAWLLDAAEETHALVSAGDDPPVSLDQLWIGDDGRLRVLEFQDPQAVPNEEPSFSLRDPGQAQAFLHRLAVVALAGPATTEPLPTVPARPLPHSVRSLLTELRAGSFESLATVVTVIRVLRQQPAAVDRKQRVASPIMAVAALIPVALMYFVQPPDPDRMAVESALLTLVQHEHSLTPAQRDQLERTVVLRSRGRLPRDPVLHARGAALLGDTWRVQWLRTLPAAGDPPALALAPVYRLFGWQSIAYGVARWSPAILAVLFLMPFTVRWGRPGSGDESLGTVAHAAGAEIVTLDGRSAGRARLLARSAVLALPVAAVAGAYYSGAHTLVLDVATGAALVSLAALGWAVWRPDRGPVELASGTVLVPGDVTVDVRSGFQWTARPLSWPALRAAVGQPWSPMTWPEVEPLARAHLAKAPNSAQVSRTMLLPLLVLAGFTLYLLGDGGHDDRAAPRVDEQRSLEAAVQRGQPDARAEMARRLLSGQGMTRDRARAAELLAGLANEGHTEAAGRLAIMYARGADVTRDGALAVELLQAAASRGDGRAATALARLYEAGAAVPASAEQAAAWYGKAAAAGDPEGMLELARCLRRGIGTRRDPRLAFLWLLEAATRHRNVRAGAEVAEAYANGVGTEEDTAKALAWYEWAADRGSPLARRGLAVLSLTGPEVLRDTVRALSLLRPMAERGSAADQVLLGWALENAKGPARNLQEAATWYTRAAERGDARAAFLLGRLYLMGNGVAQDLPVAYRWLTVARLRGAGPSEQTLAGLLKAVGDRLTHEQRGQLEAEARQWVEDRGAVTTAELRPPR